MVITSPTTYDLHTHFQVEAGMLILVAQRHQVVVYKPKSSRCWNKHAHIYFPKNASECPLKEGHFKRTKIVFQASFFSGATFQGFNGWTQPGLNRGYVCWRTSIAQVSGWRSLKLGAKDQLIHWSWNWRSWGCHPNVLGHDKDKCVWNIDVNTQQIKYIEVSHTWWFMVIQNPGKPCMKVPKPFTMKSWLVY